MQRFICIHGHFYQPPRENPWLEAIELQDSAAPYHDWNERITAECYAPNAHARFLDGAGRIERMVSNYSHISFNFGPTLLSWMKEKAPDIYQTILDADQASQERFGGHGSALAQCYNHLIMPLAPRRDKYTQVLWGIRDFESRFHRPPEGMWLPECAVDNESLDVLAELGIRFTILSPFQASRVRLLNEENWHDVNGGRIDPSMPYQVKLASGRSIAVFFYDAPIARAVAFEQLLTNGEHFAHRLTQAFDDSRGRDQLVHIATDGESYGHHFRYGDMALAYALRSIEAKGLARVTVYGQYLESHPPTHEVEIHSNSAWSCAHGVDRWQKHCGCNSGGHPGWNQHWRKPLREAFDWLREELAPRYETKAKAFFRDPWAARDEYIAVILSRSPETMAQFFGHHAYGALSESDQIVALRLLEMQRHALLMFTSCAWFFDEISGLESVQVIQYAARALQLTRDLLDENLEPQFLKILGQARSNIREHGNGHHIYEKFVKPAVITREAVGAHYAVSSLFESYAEETRIYSFTVRQEERQLFVLGNARLALGRIRVTFEITRNSDTLSYGVVYMGDHNLNGGVRLDTGPAAYALLVGEMHAAFERADFPELIRLMDRHFGESQYSLKNLFRDEQRKVLDQILAATRNEIHNTYRLLTDRHAPLLRFLADLRVPALRPLEVAMEFVINSELRRQFESETMDLERVHSLLSEAEATGANLEVDSLAYALKARVDRLSDLLVKTPEDLAVLQRFIDAAELARLLPFEVNLWKPQNTYYRMSIVTLPDIGRRAEEGDRSAQAWKEAFATLGLSLGFHIERPVPAARELKDDPRPANLLRRP
jgi:alpha-amylase/alpha-mannosidase (GH57 family)